ncbi:MAG: funZ protein [Thermodesulfobacteriota bacterium]
MKPVAELNLGYRDAENYKRRENKNLFNQLFVRTSSLEKVCEPNIFFLVGEKGTGKTAYAVYFENNQYRKNNSVIRYIRETEYQKFVAMKHKKNLSLSDFTNIWKVIIYLLLAEQIISSETDNPWWNKFFKLRSLQNAIDEFYKKAFAPEIIYAINFVEESELAAKLISKYVDVGSKDRASVSFSESRFQINLTYIQRQFEEALTALKLQRNHLLFIDGIDIRPGAINYNDYLDCIKGLANAIWSVNNDFFANIKDSPGRLRVVLLVRPDIFYKIGLQNLNSKIRDNSIVLNWLTTYREYRNSPLFLMADKLLSFQQEKALNLGEAWAHYFPFDTPRLREPQTSTSSFITFLRYSLYRPRDFLAIMSILRENFIEQGRRHNEVFQVSDFRDPAFTRKYSDYLLGEVRDHLVFYYSSEDWEKFVQFFQFLNGNSRFDYTIYCEAFKSFVSSLKNNGESVPEFCSSPDNFLQFLYDLNVLGYVVETNDGPFFGWCFRDRSISNIAPKVRKGVRYEVHYGLMKSLDLGKTLYTTG